jgi:HSP20 family molecular chaperone IbpA
MRRSTRLQHARHEAQLHLVPPDQILDRMKETFDVIACRAFELFERNGRQVGHDLEDWFQAEKELLHPAYLNISETDAALTVEFEAPGFTEKDIQVSVEPRRLTVTGKRESLEEKKKGKTVYSEQRCNEIFRTVDLPCEVDPTPRAIKAIVDRGIVTITLTKSGTTSGHAVVRAIKVEPSVASA